MMTPRRERALIVFCSMVVTVTVFLLASAGRAQEPAQEMTGDQKVSYTLGFMVMHRIAAQGYYTDVDAFSEGMRAVTADTPPALNPKEMETIMKRVLKAAEIRAGMMKHKVDPEEAAEANAPRGPKVKLRSDPPMWGQMVVPLNTQIPSGRIDTASPQTRINFILSENPNLDIRDLQ
jgi:Domain amino terminal to FKBP-type peptidyl-prolyl isomerase